MNLLYRNDAAGEYPDSWYLATAEPDPPRPALQGAVKADVAIVGAGYTGLSAALTLAGKGLSVVVLEAHRAGFGASGRNGGQVSAAFNMDQRKLEKQLGAEDARRLWDLTIEARDLVGELCAAHAPEARFTRGLLHGTWEAGETREMRRYAAWLGERYGHGAEFLERDAFRAICNSPLYQGGLYDPNGGHVHPLRLCLGLARAAEAAGAVIHEGSEVTGFEDQGTKVVLRTRGGTVEAGHAILAGNGYLPDLSPVYAARVMPINSFIAATAPLGDLADEVLRRDVAVADDRFVVNYFRLSEDRRLLFGGRESYGLGFPTDILTALRGRMLKLFPQLEGVEITHHWGGTLAITMNRVPFVGRVAPRVLAAGGYSGHGVALSLLTGRILGEAVAGQEDRFDLMSRLPVPTFPGGAAFRTPLLFLAMTWYSMRDRLGF